MATSLRMRMEKNSDLVAAARRYAMAVARELSRNRPHALSADELKSVQPWLTAVELRSNVVLHEPGDPIEQGLFSP
jgi:hypothetical protein